MDQNAQKEEFSLGYIRILASVCGYVFDIASRQEDNYLGIDVKIIDSVSSVTNEPPRFTIQAKCTTSKYLIDRGDFYTYTLKINNYKHLIKKTIDPFILVITIVPEGIDNWISIDDIKGETLLKSCSYWISLKGEKEIPTQSTVTIKIPKQNLFTTDVMKMLMQKSFDDREDWFKSK